jgi:transposase
MSEITTIGLDLAKNVFQVQGIDEVGNVLVRKRLRRSQVLAFFAGLSRCLAGMEACATAHYWARELIALGHEVRLMPPYYGKAYVKRNKNDAADAEAICEAVKPPTMRFVAVKTAEQQSVLMMHRAREILIRQRTMLVNALRGHMAEFGLIGAQGLHNVVALIETIRNGTDERIPEGARQVLLVIADEIDEVGVRVLGSSKSATLARSRLFRARKKAAFPSAERRWACACISRVFPEPASAINSTRRRSSLQPAGAAWRQSLSEACSSRSSSSFSLRSRKCRPRSTKFIGQICLGGSLLESHESAGLDWVEIGFSAYRALTDLGPSVVQSP